MKELDKVIMDGLRDLAPGIRIQDEKNYAYAKPRLDQAHDNMMMSLGK